MFFINNEQVKKILNINESIDQIRKVYMAHGKGEAWLSKPSALSLEKGKGQKSFYKIKGGSVPSLKVCGFRLIGNYYNLNHKEKQGYSYCYLTDPKTSLPIAYIHEAYQHALRTGVTGAIALSCLANKDAQTVGIIGAGKIARTTLEALNYLFTLKRIRIYSRRESSRKAFAEEVKRTLKVQTQAVNYPEMAVRDAQLVITITNADEELVKPGWLAQGATLCSLGGNQEISHLILDEVDKFYVDDFEFCTKAGDIHAWIVHKYLSEEKIKKSLTGSIPEVIAGRKTGRVNREERILVVVQGMATCDLALARLVYDRLRTSPDIPSIHIKEEIE